MFITSEIQKNNRQGIHRRNQKRDHYQEEGRDRDGAEREAESPRAATKAKKVEKKRMRLVGSLSNPCGIQQSVSLDAEAAIQVLEPLKHLLEHFRLCSSHEVSDRPMLGGHAQLIDNNPSSRNPFTSESPPSIYCLSLPDEYG